MKKRVAVLIAALAAALACVPNEPSAATAFDPRGFLADFVPSSPHEAVPHGVPSGYSWHDRAIVIAGTTPPRADTTHMNWWGEVYVDISQQRAPNTRVAISGGKLLVLYDGAADWEIAQDTAGLGGGAWTEDFHKKVADIDMRVEDDRSRSVVPRRDENAHFWPDTGFYKVARPVRAVMSIAYTRLTLAAARGPDDRATSPYLIALGADWRTPTGECPIVRTDRGDVPICTGIGHGKYIRPTPAWRTVVFHTMSAPELGELPMPSAILFRMPDGTYPKR